MATKSPIFFLFKRSYGGFSFSTAHQWGISHIGGYLPIHNSGQPVACGGILPAALLGVKNISQGISCEGESQHRYADSDAGKEDYPGCGHCQLGRSAGEHTPPGGMRLGYSQTQVAQSRFSKDSGTKHGRHYDEERGHGVGQDMPEDYSGAGSADSFGGHYVVGLPQRNGGRTNYSYSSGHDGSGDGENNVHQGITEYRHDG